MTSNYDTCDHADEDYIDMEMKSHNNIFCQEMSSPPHPREFEFQMFSCSSGRDTTTSPADELFYKGKLLPLHLPPRLQMVEKLLQNTDSYEKYIDTFDEIFSTPFENTTPASNTPFESCNISPSESCPVSGELNPGENLLEYSDEVSGFMRENQNKSWTRKLKLIKQSSLGSKLQASRAYLKSLFRKSRCTHESSAAAAVNMNTRVMPRENQCVKNYTKVVKNTLGQIQRDRYQMSGRVTRSFNKGENVENGGRRHRRSFSGAIKRFSSTKSSSLSCSAGSCSSSSSSSSNGFQESKSFQRSISSNLDVEISIQSAIAHCKSSHQLRHSTKSGSDRGLCSLSASRIIYEDHEQQELSRG